MPFKRNPINAENMGSMARYLAALPGVAWDNAAHNLLERTLDDSGNRRIILPNAFFVTEEILKRAQRIMGDLRLNRDAIRRNLGVYGTFAATERVLMAAARAGGDRQELHEIIRQHSLSAWEALQSGQPNPLVDSLSSDPQLSALLDSATIRALLNADSYVGDAPQRARELAAVLREALD
jgi:adenylosuccinate lyase